jgi:protoheme IX farnesyltransferase
MLPVVAPPTVVARKILIYSYVMVAATLALAPYAGWLYTVSAAGLGAWFLLEAHRLRRRVARIARTGTNGPPGTSAAAAESPTTAEGACAGVVRPSANPAPMRLFHLSIAYLTLLFAVIAVTSLLPWGGW